MPKLPSSKVYIGVDPGASGGLARLEAEVQEGHAMPATERDIWDWFDRAVTWTSVNGGCFAVIEKVQGYIGSGQPGSSMFKFGQNYGFLRGCLVGTGVPFEEVTPQAWQKGLGIPGRKRNETKTAWKNRLKAKAQQLFPKEKVTLATADALLIAEFCRRKHEGRL